MKNLIIFLILTLSVLSYSNEINYYEVNDKVDYAGYLIEDVLMGYYLDVDDKYSELKEGYEKLTLKYEKQIKLYEELMYTKKYQDSLLNLKINALNDINNIYKESYNNSTGLQLENKILKITTTLSLTIGISSLIGVGFFSLGQYMASQN